MATELSLKRRLQVAHHLAVVSPAQIARMKTGRTESTPADYRQQASIEDRRLYLVRKANEEIADARELERATRSGYE